MRTTGQTGVMNKRDSLIQVQVWEDEVGPYASQISKTLNILKGGELLLLSWTLSDHGIPVSLLR